MGYTYGWSKWNIFTMRHCGDTWCQFYKAYFQITSSRKSNAKLALLNFKIYIQCIVFFPLGQTLTCVFFIFHFICLVLEFLTAIEFVWKRKQIINETSSPFFTSIHLRHITLLYIKSVDELTPLNDLFHIHLSSTSLVGGTVQMNCVKKTFLVWYLTGRIVQSDS